MTDTRVCHACKAVVEAWCNTGDGPRCLPCRNKRAVPQPTTLEQENAALRTERDRLEAACAAMRDAIQFYIDRDSDMSDAEFNDNHPGWKETSDWNGGAKAALASDAGARLLERLAELEQDRARLFEEKEQLWARGAAMDFALESLLADIEQFPELKNLKFYPAAKEALGLNSGSALLERLAAAEQEASDENRLRGEVERLLGYGIKREAHWRQEVATVAKTLDYLVHPIACTYWPYAQADKCSCGLLKARDILARLLGGAGEEQKSDG